MEKKDEHNFDVTPEQRKQLTPQEIGGFIKAFKCYDLNEDGTMSENEFKNILIDLGERKTTDEEAKTKLDENDTNRDGVLSFEEYINMMIKYKKINPSAVTDIVEAKDGTMLSKVTTLKGQGYNIFSHQQCAVFAKLINFLLKDDEQLKVILPMAAEPEALFHAFENGILLAKLC